MSGRRMMAPGTPSTSVGPGTPRTPSALTIAGSDSGGGAGIQADLKVFQALGIFGTSAIAALTAQNTRGVSEFLEVPAAFVAAQIDAVLGDIGADAVKTGMLARADVVEAVAAKVREHAVARLVVDPVMLSKSGARLLHDDAVEALERSLLPLALLVTPNAAEAEVLTGVRVVDRESMREAARRIAGLGARAVLVKGGHVEIAAGRAIDMFLDDTGALHEIDGPRHDALHTHGTGCALSAAIVGLLARGLPLIDAVTEAKRRLSRAIAGGHAPGKGHGVPDHRLFADGED